MWNEKTDSTVIQILKPTNRDVQQRADGATGQLDGQRDCLRNGLKGLTSRPKANRTGSGWTVG